MDGGGCVPPAPRAQVLGGSPGVCLRPQSLPLLLLWSHGCKPHWLSGLCVWGAIHWVGVLKVWVLGVGSKPFIPQGEARIWGFPSDCMAPYRAGVYDKGICLSCSFRYRYFLVPRRMRVARLASGLLSENVAPRVAVHSVRLIKGEHLVEP